MNEAQQMVLEFHRRFDSLVANSPTIPDEKTKALRVRLIQEEFDELKEALNAKDLPNIAKELADLLTLSMGLRSRTASIWNRSSGKTTDRI